MSIDERRIRRPKLPRTAARRSLSVLFVPPRPPTSDGAGSEPHPAGPTEPWNDVIARSVELGYRVIDDYVRQGEQIARAMGSQGGAPFPGMPLAGMPPLTDPQDFARRMSQYAMDVATLWMQMMQGAQGAAPWMSAFTGFAPAPPAGSGATRTTPPFAGFPTPPFGAPFAAPASAPQPETSARGGQGAYTNGTEPPRTRDASAPLRIAVAVSSVKLAEVVVDLRRDVRVRGIVVQSLRDGDRPRIDDLSVARDGASGAFTVRIRVPADQPAGLYRGAITDEDDGRSIGSLELHVGAE